MDWTFHTCFWVLIAILFFSWSIPITTAIYAGKLAAPGELPYVVRVRTQSPDFTTTGICGGTILSSNVIVTAAHCIETATAGSESSLIKIFAGQTRLDHLSSITTQVRTVRKVIKVDEHKMHSRYGIRYDLALLHLSFPLIFNTYVQPLALPDSYDFHVLEDKAVIGGWGQTRIGENESITTVASSKSLLTDVVTLVDSVKCVEWVKKFEAYPEIEEELFTQYFSTIFVCAGGNGSNACPGDSGGPLVCNLGKNEYLCGVLKGGARDSCAPVGPPTYFTNVKVVVSNMNEILHNLKPRPCNPNEFVCGQKCVHQSKRCDRVNDCDQGSDEIGCGICSRSSNEFLCNTRDRCVDVAYICDGDNNCADGSDEFGCVNCKFDEFKCRNNSSTCVSAQAVCDGVKHCDDGSDEIGCGECSLIEFKCKNGRCVHSSKLCDGRNDCTDGSDEFHCGSCSKDEFQCDQEQEQSQCISASVLCNGVKDCVDGNDEENCLLCDANSFQCGNSVCLHAKYRCDGVVDCADATDEKKCDTQQYQVSFSSLNSSNASATMNKIDWTDEEDAYIRCPEHHPFFTRFKNTTINFLVNTTNHVLCQVTGLKYYTPHLIQDDMKWSREGETISESGGRISITRSGYKLYLRFENISKADAGVYRCTAMHFLCYAEYDVRVVVDEPDLSCHRNLDKTACLSRNCYFIPDNKICVQRVIPDCGTCEAQIAQIMDRFNKHLIVEATFYNVATGFAVLLTVAVIMLGCWARVAILRARRRNNGNEELVQVKSSHFD